MGRGARGTLCNKFFVVPEVSSRFSPVLLKLVGLDVNIRW